MASIEETKNTKEKMVKIRLPRVKGETHAYCCINGTAWQIQRGVEHTVPAYIAEIFHNAEKAQLEADEYEMQLAEDEAASLK